jgi:hypothetical protein
MQHCDYLANHNVLANWSQHITDKRDIQTYKKCKAQIIPRQNIVLFSIIHRAGVNRGHRGIGLFGDREQRARAVKMGGLWMLSAA